MTSYFDSWDERVQNQIDISSTYNEISTLSDPLQKKEYIKSITDTIQGMINNNDINEKNDPKDVVNQVVDAHFPNRSVANLGDNVKRNLMYKTDEFEQYGLDPDQVASAARFIANNYSHLNLTMRIFEPSKKDFADLKGRVLDNAVKKAETLRYVDGVVSNSLFPESDQPPNETSTRLDVGLTGDESYIDENGEKRVRIDSTLGKMQSPNKEIKQQALDDLMAGNAENLYTALISENGNKTGSYIGVYFIDEYGHHELIGAMEDPNKELYVVSQKRLVGVAASEQMLEYLSSWFFDYTHENINTLFEEGTKSRVPGVGRATSDTDIPGVGGAVTRAWANVTSKQIGELEFQYAIDPLKGMLDKKAKELGVKLLNEEQSQDVLRTFMDRFERAHSDTLEHEPLSYLKGAARWTNNFWELDFNLREVWIGDK